jgi:hypothetical protein
LLLKAGLPDLIIILFYYKFRTKYLINLNKIHIHIKMYKHRNYALHIIRI